MKAKTGHQKFREYVKKSKRRRAYLLKHREEKIVNLRRRKRALEMIKSGAVKFKNPKDTGSLKEMVGKVKSKLKV